MQPIRVLMVRPECPPEAIYLQPTLGAMRNALSLKFGDSFYEIETKKIAKNIYVLFNKDRFLADLQGNRWVKDEILAGVFYVMAFQNKSHPRSLTDDEVERYTKRFLVPEYWSEPEVVESNLNALFRKFV